jgi:hypothetical protein
MLYAGERGGAGSKGKDGCPPPPFHFFWKHVTHESRPENIADRTIGDVLCYFRGWQVYVETHLDCSGVTEYNAPPVLYLSRFTVTLNTFSPSPLFQCLSAD